MLPATTLTLAADRDVVIGYNVDYQGGIFGAASAPLNIVIAARARGGSVGFIKVLKSLVSYGGNITLGGGDLAASDFAVGHDSVEGVFIDREAHVDATGNGSSQPIYGTAEYSSVIPVGSSGGNIVIRGKGAPTAQTTNGSGIYITGDFGGNAIVTAGNGSINLEGHGGNSTASNSSYWASSAGIRIGNNSFIKAGNGNITLKGYQGSGTRRFGISSFTDTGEEGSLPVFVGTNGAVNIEGDSLAILEGNFGLYAGLASAIKAPIIGGNTGRSFRLTKTGPGVLTLSRDANAWGAENTNPTATDGIFTSENTVLLSGVDAFQAFYAFGETRPDYASASTPVYLRLNTGLSSVYGNTPAFTYSLYDASTEGNVISSELANPSGTAVWTGSTIVPTASSGRGGYLLTYASGITLGNSSYLLNPGDAVLYSVTPRPVTVTPVAKSKVYGNVDPELTYAITSGNLVGDDKLMGTLSRAAGNSVGNYVISPEGFDNEENWNYAVTTATGLLTITAPVSSTEVKSTPTLESSTEVKSTLTLERSTEVKSTLNSVYVVPPVVSRPVSAQLSLGLQLVDVAPAPRSQSNDNAGSGSSALAFDPVAAAKRAPGTVLVLTGGVKRAADDTDERSDKKAASSR